MELPFRHLGVGAVVVMRLGVGSGDKLLKVAVMMVTDCGRGVMDCWLW